MKRVWIAVTLLWVLFAWALFHSNRVAVLSYDLSVLLEEAEEYAEQGKWEAAKDLTDTAKEKWEAKDIYLHITLRHNDTDAIYTGFREVLEFIECEEEGEYSAANACLIAELTLLSEAEQLTIKNVF